MVKRCFSALLFFVAAAAAVSQAQAPAGQELYPAISNSVIFLEHVVSIKASDSSCPDLWRRYEQASEKKILDTDVEAMSGSGFFIDGDGYILTNRHVAKVGGADDARKMVVDGVGNKLDNDVKGSFSSQERDTMKKDIAAMASKAAYSFLAFSGMQKLGKVETLAISPDKAPDLALLKVQGNAYRALRLAPSSAIGRELTGTDVYSFGYPLGGMLDAMFKDRAVTMNRGAVSAVRTNADYNIQHSAAISHGNSGGPLVDSQGQVVGVNTASLQEQSGNSLFYAVDAAKIHEFLIGSGFSRIDLWNRRLPDPIAATANVPLNALGEIEVSSSVILNVPKDAEIFIDGKRIGQGTMVYDPTSALSELELKGNGGSFKAKLRLINNMPGTTSIKLGLERRAVPVKIESEPSGATVVTDGKTLGTTPLMTTLMPDAYPVRLLKEGYWYPDSEIVVGAGAKNEFPVNGEKAFVVNIRGTLGDADAVFRFESERGVSTYRPGETVRLPKGEWTFSVQGSTAFQGVKKNIIVADGDVSFDLSSIQKTSKLRLAGFDKKATLWIDGKVFPVAEGGVLQLPLGAHTVYAWLNGSEPLEKRTITIKDDDSAFIKWDRKIGHDAKRNGMVAGAIGSGVVGAGLITLGIVVASNDNAIESLDNHGLSIALGAVCLIVSGGFDYGAWSEDLQYRKQLAYMKSLESR